MQEWSGIVHGREGDRSFLKTKELRYENGMGGPLGLDVFLQGSEALESSGLDSRVCERQVLNGFRKKLFLLHTLCFDA